MKVTFNGGNATLSLVTKVPKSESSLQYNLSYRQTYESTSVVPLSDPLLTNIVNTIPTYSGALVKIDNSSGTIISPAPYSYNVGYTGTNETLMKWSNGIGYTTPFKVNFPDFTFLNSTHRRGHEYFEYDLAGSWNVLVFANFDPYPFGISPFVSQLLDYTNFNTTIKGFSTFSLTLIGTNINLEPMDVLHYLKHYEFYILIVILIGGAYVASTYSIAKRKYAGKNANKHGNDK